MRPAEQERCACTHKHESHMDLKTTDAHEENCRFCACVDFQSIKVTIPTPSPKEEVKLEPIESVPTKPPPFKRKVK